MIHDTTSQLTHSDVTHFCCSSSFCSEGGELRSELEKLSSSSLGGHRIELFDLEHREGELSAEIRAGEAVQLVLGGHRIELFDLKRVARGQW